MRHQEGQVLVGLELLVGRTVRSQGHLAQRRQRLDLDLRLTEGRRARVQGVTRVVRRTRLHYRVSQLHYPW